MRLILQIFLGLITQIIFAQTNANIHNGTGDIVNGSKIVYILGDTAPKQEANISLNRPNSDISDNEVVPDCEQTGNGVYYIRNESNFDIKVVFDNSALSTTLIGIGQSIPFYRSQGIYNLYLNPFSSNYSVIQLAFSKCKTKVHTVKMSKSGSYPNNGYSAPIIR